MATFKQAARKSDDGPVAVTRTDDGEHVLLSATTGGREERLLVSEYNAARLFAILGIMLGNGAELLSKEAGKIKL